MSDPRPQLPEAVFRLALLRDLKPQQRELVQAEARLDVEPADQLLTVQGQYSDRFWFVLDGQVTHFRETPDRRTVALGTLGPGDWFGEINVLSHRPSMATLRTLVPCSFLVIEPALFKVLYGDKQGTFRKLIDARYRERALAVHLQVAPLFRHLDEAQLQAIAPLVTFEDHEKGSTIARAGQAADALYLVRSGAVKCTVAGPRGPRILGYYMANSSFGERAHLQETSAWPGDYAAMAATSLLRIPRGCFDAMPELLSRLRATALQLVAEEGSPGAEQTQVGRKAQQRDVMVTGESAKGGMALAINLGRCIRCNACVESCVSVHEDRVPRLSKAGPRVDHASGVQFALASSCYNCDIPECMIACPYGAIRRNANGLIRFVWDNCVGCQACTTACPYEVISMTPPPPAADAPVRSERHWFLRTLPFVGKYFEGNHPVGAAAPKHDTPVLSALRRKEVQGKAIKCDLCEGLPFEACVYNCPTQAIMRIAPEDLLVGDDGFSLTGARPL